MRLSLLAFLGAISLAFAIQVQAGQGSAISLDLGCISPNEPQQGIYVSPNQVLTVNFEICNSYSRLAAKVISFNSNVSIDLVEPSGTSIAGTVSLIQSIKSLGSTYLADAVALNPATGKYQLVVSNAGKGGKTTTVALGLN
jgi:hypothetical protein